MRIETHLLGGAILFVVRPEQVQVTGKSGSCLQLEVPEDKGVSLLILPADDSNIYVFLGQVDIPSVAYVLHPYSPRSAATYLITHNLEPMRQEGVVTHLRPPPNGGSLMLGGGIAKDTGTNVLIMHDMSKPSEWDAYLAGHNAFEVPSLETLAELRFLWSAIESAVIFPPFGLGLTNLLMSFSAGMSFAQKFPNIVKWALKSEDLPFPLWSKDTNLGILCDDLAQFEAMLAEHSDEWKGQPTDDSPTLPDAELSPELQAKLTALRERWEKGGSV